MTALAPRHVSSHSLPIELASQVLNCVIASSVHRLCTAPAPVHEADEDADSHEEEFQLSWDMRVAIVLSAVSFSFHELTRQTVWKAFAVEPHDPRWAERVLGQFTILRNQAISHQRPYGLRAPIPSHLTPLFNAYMHLFSATALRRVCAPSTWRFTHVHILKSLSLALECARRVLPIGVGFVLEGAIVDEMVFVHIGARLIQAKTELDASLASMLSIANEAFAAGERNKRQADIKAHMSETLASVECLEQQCRSEIWADAQVSIKPCVTWEALDLSDIASTLSIYAQNVVFQLDEHDLQRRARTLLEHWRKIGDKEDDECVAPF